MARAKTLQMRIRPELAESRFTERVVIDGKEYIRVMGKPTLYGKGTNRSYFNAAMWRLAEYEDAAEKAWVKEQEKEDQQNG